VLGAVQLARLVGAAGDPPDRVEPPAGGDDESRHLAGRALVVGDAGLAGPLPVRKRSAEVHCLCKFADPFPIEWLMTTRITPARPPFSIVDSERRCFRSALQMCNLKPTAHAGLLQGTKLIHFLTRDVRAS
jgi:hypothetical protein